MKLSQLRAISYATTKRGQERAIEALENRYGLDFYDFRGKMAYKGSPLKLLGDLNDMKRATWARVADYAAKYHKNIGEIA